MTSSLQTATDNLDTTVTSDYFNGTKPTTQNGIYYLWSLSSIMALYFRVIIKCCFLLSRSAAICYTSTMYRLSIETLRLHVNCRNYLQQFEQGSE